MPGRFQMITYLEMLPFDCGKSQKIPLILGYHQIQITWKALQTNLMN